MRLRHIGAIVAPSILWAVLVSVVLLPCAAAAPRYTALGASDALGYGSSNFVPNNPGAPNNGYVFRIHAWMQERYAPWMLSNLGGMGYTAPDIRRNALDAAVAGHPDIVTLWAGANDVKDSMLANEATDTLSARFEDAYTAILQRLRDETDAFIVTANLPDMSRIPIALLYSPAQRQLAHDDALALNAVITRIAATYGVPVVDLYDDPDSYDPANFASDGFHPNDAGYAHLADLFEGVLRAGAWRVVSGLGDVDGDGSVTAADAAATLRLASGLSAPDDRQRVAADTSPPGGDGAITLADAALTLRRALGLVPASGWR